MRIWIFQSGEPLHCDEGTPRPMRAMNLANALVENGHEVVIWSSAFRHQDKAHRAREFQSLAITPQLTVNLVPSRGYKKHIGMGRLVDHAGLALALFEQLSTYSGKRPDIAFVGYPPIEAAALMVSWLKSQRIPSILDVKDLWPWIFAEALPGFVRRAAPLLLAPYAALARQAIGEATAITSITESFLAATLAYGNRTRTSYDSVFPLVPGPSVRNDIALRDQRSWWDAKGVDLTHNRRFCFVGGISRAYDFSPVSDAMRSVLADGIDFELVICGEGEECDRVKYQFRGIKRVKFAGWIDLPQMQSLMQASVGVVAPYVSTRDFTMSIPNKIIDSLALSLPVITSLDGETRTLIEKNGVGLYCSDERNEWAGAFRKLLLDRNLQVQMSKNAIDLYQSRYSYEKVYGGFVSKLECVARRYQWRAVHDHLG